jgi:IS5 family transposase
VVDLNTKLIVCIAHGKGKQHDFKIWKKSKTAAKSEIKHLADKGYQGIKKNHKKSQTPIKKKRGKKLSKEEKKFNRELAKERIVIEHVNRYLKIFRILSERYRNRRKRFNLRLSLISGIYNYGLSCQSNFAIAL